MNKLNIALSLNGKWMLAADPDDRGVRERWFQEGPPDGAMEGEIPSPEGMHHGTVWHFRTFSLDDAWTGRCVFLHFEAADHAAAVWVNGKPAGSHEGGFVPFSLEVTEQVHPGGNLLAVRLTGDSSPCAGEAPFGGLWGGVSLEGTAHVRLSSVFVMPDPQRACVQVLTEAVAKPGAEVRLSIEGTPFAAVGKPGPMRLDFPDFKPWSPEQPRLYRLRAELLGPDGPVHAKTVRFGMRDFTVKEDRFFLNNRPLHVKALLHQPGGGPAGRDAREQARRDVQTARDAGVNLLRLRGWPAPSALLEAADELGMLVQEDAPLGVSGGLETVRGMVVRDRNHPSLVVWGVPGGLEPAEGRPLRDDLCLLARELDPTRLILGDGGTAAREPACLLRPRSAEVQEMDAPHVPPRAPVDLDMENYFRHIGDPAMLVTVSASGCGDETAPNGEAAMAAAAPGFAERGLDRLFGDLAGLTRAMEDIQCDAARMQLDALRANPKVAGYCHGRLTDGRGGFPAGVTDREGREKPVLRALAEAQQPLRPVIQIPETNLSPRQEVPVTVLLANEGRVEGQGELSLQLTGPTGQMLWKKRRALPKIPKHGRPLWEGAISASGSCGPHRFTVRLLRNGQIAASADADLYVVEPAPPRELTVHLLDPHGEWTGRFGGLAAEGNLLAPVHVIPPLANTIRAYPDNDLAQVLAQVRGGAVAVFFGPPDDWNDLAALMAGGADLAATSRNTVDAPVPAVHYAKVHPVFDKLPSRGLMRQPYRNVAPAKTFAETGEEDICGTFTPGAEDCWGTGILVRRYGAGRLVFTHLRLLEHLGADPVADRVFSNLAAHLTRRSVPPEQPLPPDQRLVEWMRRERLHSLRRWMVIGEFPNWNRGAGFHTVYPPETAQDFDAVYPGWYRAVRWGRWHSSAAAGHLVDLQTAFSPVFSTAPRDDRAVGYAYAEFVGERRQGARMVLGVRNAMKVWLNGELVFETDRQVPGGLTDTETVEVRVRQGKNTLLVKCAKVPGPFGFSLDLERSGTAPLAIQWWR
ncbi:MAG TPA: glycoside hydrolase family 2 TIM barrel-domain containing protein [Candidatus Hydrogenedentes bacterium]|nr:glycoside hydrolase family 2 TIM barrel-domain containing protein [Candidatus Hydrogenedentota bacterium]HOC72131.1 glycoside hydrolase family 2 TIM barrel-domain containing protein [Candidatus Hydrogenedentota bacterium]